jgi:hypothetical protein
MLNRYEFEAVAKYLPADELAVKAIRKQFPTQAPELIKAIEAGESPECNGEDIQTFLLDLLHNESRLYTRYTARGSYGNYYIDVRGLGGVYFYHAPEFDLTGYYLSIDDAGADITMNWNDSLTSYDGRSYREPFVSQKMVDALNKSKADANFKQVQRFLSRPEGLRDLSALQELLVSVPIQQLDSAIQISLDSCDDLSRQSIVTQLTEQLQRIRAAAESDVESLTSRLKSTHGVARMGLAQALGTVKNQSEDINLTIQKISLRRS